MGCTSCDSFIGQETASFIQSLSSSNQFGRDRIPAFFLFQPSSGFSPLCIALQTQIRAVLCKQVLLFSLGITCGQSTTTKVAQPKWVQLSRTLPKLHPEDADFHGGKEMGPELLLRLWRGRWTGNCVAPFKHIALGKIPLRSFVRADERKSRFDLSYKPFPVFPMCLSLRYLTNMFYSYVLGLSLILGVPADRLCKALQCSSP